MTTEGHNAAGPGRRLGLLLIAGMVLSQMTTHMTSVAVPTIIDDFQVGLERAGWIISAYLLPVCVLMPSWGAAGDLFGRRRVFRVGLLIFGVGALVSGLATSLPALLAGQAIQAAGASALNPNGTALIAMAAGGGQRGRALGRLRMILSLAGIVGAPASGLLIQVAGWHAIFAAGPVVALALALVLGRAGTEERPPSSGTARFDVAGALTLTAALLALLAALSLGSALGWTSPAVLLLAAVALVGLLAIGPLEARQARPLIPPALFREGAYTAVVAAGFLQAFACFGSALLGPLLLRHVFSLAPAPSGWLLAGFAAGMAAGGLPGGRLTDRFGGQRATIGALIGAAAALGLLALAARTVQPALFVAGLAGSGFASSVALTAMGAFVLQVCGEEQRGLGMGVFTMISIMGDIVGVALLTQLLGGQTGADLGPAFSHVYLLAAGVALLGIAPALAMRARPVVTPAVEVVAAGPP